VADKPGAKRENEKCDYEKMVDGLFDTNSKMVIGNTTDSPCTKNGEPF
jgi:hypothetical protein